MSCMIMIQQKLLTRYISFIYTVQLQVYHASILFQYNATMHSITDIVNSLLSHLYMQVVKIRLSSEGDDNPIKQVLFYRKSKSLLPEAISYDEVEKVSRSRISYYIIILLLLFIN